MLRAVGLKHSEVCEGKIAWLVKEHSECLSIASSSPKLLRLISVTPDINCYTNLV